MQDLSNYSNIQTAVTKNEKFIEDLIAISNLKAVNIDTTIVEVSGNNVKIEGDRTSLVSEYVVLGHEIAYITSVSYSDPYTTLTLAREQLGTKQDTTDLTGYYIRSVDIFTDVKSWNYNTYNSSKTQVFPFNLENGQVIIYDSIANWGKGKTYSLKRKKSAIYIFKGFDNEKMLKYVGFADSKSLYGARYNDAERVKIEFHDKFIQWYNVNIRRQQILKYIKPKEFMVNVLEYSTDMVKYISGNIEDDFNTTNYVFLNEYEKFKDILGEYAKTGVRFYFNELEELCITTDLTVSNLVSTGVDITNTNLLDIQKSDEAGFVINKVTGTYYERTALYDFENPSQFNNQYVIYGKTLDVDNFTLLNSDDEYNLLTITDTNLANFTTQYDLVILKDDVTGFELHGKVIYYEGTSPNVETTISFYNADKDNWLDYFGKLDYLKSLSYDDPQNFTLYYVRNELPIIYKHSSSFTGDTENSRLNIALRPQIIGQENVNLLQTSAKFGATADLTNAKYTGQFENIDNIYGTFDDGTSFGGLTYNQELVQFTDPDNYPPLFVLSNKASDYSPNDLIEGNIYTIVELGDTDWNVIGFVGTPTVNENFTKNSTVGSGTGLARDLVRGESALLKYNTFDNSNLEINIEGTDSNNYNAKINFKNTMEIDPADIYEIPDTILKEVSYTIFGHTYGWTYEKKARNQVSGSFFEINSTIYNNISIGDVVTLKEPISFTNSDEREEFMNNKDTNWIIKYLFEDSGKYYMGLNGTIKSTFSFNVFPSNSIVYLQEFYILGNPVIEYTSGFESSNDTSIEEYDEQEQVIDGKLLNFEGVGKLASYYGGFAGIETNESDKKYILPLQIRNHPELQKFDLITITDDIYTGYDGNTDFMILGIEESDVTKGDTNKYYVMNINNFDATEDTFDVEKLLDFVPVNDITYNSQGNEGLPQQTDEVTTDTNIITSNDDVYGSVSIKPIGQGDLKADVISLEDGLLSIDNITISDTKYTSFLDYTTTDNEYKVIKIDNEYILTRIESYSSVSDTANLIVVKRNFLNNISTATNIVEDRLVSFFEIISGSFDGDLITQNLKAGNQTDFVKLDIENGTQIASTSNVTVSNKTNILNFNGTSSTGSLKLNGITTGVTDAFPLTVGKTYIIVTVGDTSWTSIGASSNTVGVVFTATGIGSGTGVAEIAYYGQQLGSDLSDSVDYGGSAYDGAFIGNGDLTQNKYLKYDGTDFTIKGNIYISGGSVNIDAHSSILQFTDTDSYIRLNYDGGIASNYGLRINETSLTNKFVFDDSEFTVISQGDVSISNNINALLFDSVTDKSSLKLNATSDTSTTVTTTNFVIGKMYAIKTVGDTDFTLIGASANTVGIVFIATGIGGGTTGEAYPSYYSQQLGADLEDSSGGTFDGVFVGNAVLSNNEYLKYDGTDLTIKTDKGYLGSASTYFDISNSKLFIGSAEINSNIFQVGATTGEYIGFDGTDLNIVGNITVTSGNATVTFRQDEAPTVYKTGDIWVDTDSDEEVMYVAMGEPTDNDFYGGTLTGLGLYGEGLYGGNWRLIGTNNSESLTYTTVKIGKDAVDTDKHGFSVNTEGWVDINNGNNRLYFDPNDTGNSYLKIASDGSSGNLEVGDTTSDNYLQYSSSLVNIKSKGTINISNTWNELLFTDIASTSYISMNSGTQQIGRVTGLTGKSDFDGFYFGDTTLATGEYIYYDGTLNMSGSIVITGGSIDISSSDSSIKFTETADEAYITLNSDKIKIGKDSIESVNNGLYVADHETIGSATNAFSFNVDDGTMILKSEGTIDISNNTGDNQLYMGASNSRLQLNKVGSYHQQQIGSGLTDSVDTDFDGLFLGDGLLTNGHYVKYNGTKFKFGENTNIAGTVTAGDTILVKIVAGDTVCKYGEIDKVDHVFGFDFTSPVLPTTEYFKLADSTNIVTAGNFVVDSVYTITTVGSTDFTLIGALANTVGITFQATGVGVGTGTATQYTQGMQLKTQGTIDISNTWNGLYFTDILNTSYISMNSGEQQIGHVIGITGHTPNDYFEGFYFGDTTLINNKYIYYDGTALKIAGDMTISSSSTIAGTSASTIKSGAAAGSTSNTLLTTGLLGYNKDYITYNTTDFKIGQNAVDLGGGSFGDGISLTTNTYLKVANNTNEIFFDATTSTDSYLSMNSGFQQIGKVTGITTGAVPKLDFNGFFFGDIDMANQKYMYYDNSGNFKLDIYDGSINIGNSSNYLDFYTGGGASFSKIYLNNKKIHLGYGIGGTTENGFYVADDITYSASTNALKFNTAGTLDFKTEGTIDISNNNNALLFTTGAGNSNLKMNYDGANYYKQQIGSDLEDSIENGANSYSGFLFGDPTISNKNFFKYNQDDESTMFAGKYFNEIAYVSTKEEFISALDITEDYDGYGDISAGSFVAGKRYEITLVGTTDFTLIGAASNTLGVEFIATGVGSGTGTAEGINEFRFINEHGLKIKKINLLNSFDISSMSLLHFGTSGYIIPNSDIKEILGEESIEIIFGSLVLDISTNKTIINGFTINSVGNGTLSIDLGTSSEIKELTILEINGEIKGGGTLSTLSENYGVNKCNIVNPKSTYGGNIFEGIFSLKDTYIEQSISSFSNYTVFKNCYNISNLFLTTGSISSSSKIVVCDNCNSINECFVVDGSAVIDIVFKNSNIISDSIISVFSTNNYIFDNCNNINNIRIGALFGCKIKDVDYIQNVEVQNYTLEGTITYDSNNSWNIPYETSWTAISTNLRSQNITVTHSLGFDVTDLAIKLYWNSSASDATAREVTPYQANPYGASTGYEVEGVDTDNIKINTASGGVWRLTGELTTGFYKIKVTKI